MRSKLSLLSFCLKNFKAVQNSKTIKFTPLTVLIGNNGSGKSSIVEAMETFQSIVLNGLDEAMIPWQHRKPQKTTNQNFHSGTCTPSTLCGLPACYFDRPRNYGFYKT